MADVKPSILSDFDEAAATIVALEAADANAIPERGLLLGNAYLRAGRLGLALREANGLLRAGRFPVRAQILKVRALMASGKLDDAQPLAEKLASAVGPKALPVQIVLLLARHFLSRDGRRAALSFLERAERIDDPEVTSLRAVLLAGLQRAEEAASLVSASLPKVAPEARPGLQVLVARLKVLTKDYTSASNFFALALRKLAPDPRLYYRAARAAFLAERFPLAERWAGMALALGNSNVSVLRSVGRIRLAANNLVNAVSAFRLALKEQDDIETRLLLVTALVRMENYAGANEELADIFEREPAHQGARLTQIRLLQEVGALEEACAAATLFAADHPQDETGIELRGDTLAAMGRGTEAAECYRRLVAARPDDDAIRGKLAECTATEAGTAPATLADRFSARAIATRDKGIFAPSWSDDEPQPTGSFAAAFGAHARTVGALMLRDMRVRFGRTRLGYFWAIGEPIILVWSHVIFWILVGTMQRGPITPGLFLSGGIITFYMFQHTYTSVAGLLKGQIVILAHPQVHPWDIIFARAVLELATQFIVFVLFMLGLAVAGTPMSIVSPLSIGAVLLLAWCGGLGLGLLVEAVSPVMESIHIVMMQAVRFLYFVSGIFYAMDYVPPSLNRIIIWNPLVHLIAIMRAEVSRDHHLPSEVSFSYAAAFMIALLLAGLLAERVMRHRVLEAA
jgi:capsular polysaccharide transport system permease protein